MISENTTPIIVVSFGKNTTISDILKAKTLGMDIAEIRVDLLSDYQNIIEQLKNIPILLTIRTEKEGGAWQKTEAERLVLFEKLIPLVDWVDIELSSVIKNEIYQIAKQNAKQVIFSAHDFNATPDLSTIKKLAKEVVNISDEALFKIATMINNTTDLHTLVQFLQEAKNKNLVVIGMGQLGKISRIFFPSLGSKLVFTYLNKATASGQLSLLDTKKLLDLFYQH